MKNWCQPRLSLGFSSLSSMLRLLWLLGNRCSDSGFPECPPKHPPSAARDAFPQKFIVTLRSLNLGISNKCEYQPLLESPSTPPWVSPAHEVRFNSTELTQNLVSWRLTGKPCGPAHCACELGRLFCLLPLKLLIVL